MAMLPLAIHSHWGGRPLHGGDAAEEFSRTCRAARMCGSPAARDIADGSRNAALTTRPIRNGFSRDGDDGKMKRRSFLGLAAGAVATAGVCRASRARRPIHRARCGIIVGTAAGGGMDIAGRVIAQALTERLGQQFFVEDRPGAGTNVGTELVVRSTAGRLHTAVGRRRQTRSTRRSIKTSISTSFAISRRSRPSRGCRR